jgi:hypothetical protein
MPSSSEVTACLITAPGTSFGLVVCQKGDVQLPAALICQMKLVHLLLLLLLVFELAGHNAVDVSLEALQCSK